MLAFDRVVFVLLLENHATRLYRGFCRSSEQAFSELASFSPDATGQAALTAWLRARRVPAVHLLVNLPEVVELRENIPHLRGAERRAVLARKLRQQFGDNPFVMATSLGVVTNRPRQEERLRLVALPRAALQGWLDALAGTPLAGIHDVPQIIECLARRQANWPSCGLALTAHHGAFRQTLLVGATSSDNTLSVVTSRLLSVPPEREVDWIAEETERLRVYLCRQQLIAADAVLPVYPLLSADGQAGLRAAFSRPGLERCALQDPGFAVEFGEQWLLSAWMRYRPRQQYAPTALRQDYWLPFRRRTALGAGFLVLLAGVVWGGMDFRQARAIEAQTAMTHLAIERMRKEYQEEVSRHPELPRGFDAHAAHALLMAYDQYVEADSPEWMLTDLRNLSTWLDRHPEIRLEKLRWQAKERALTLEGMASSPEDVARLVRDLARQGIDCEIRWPTVEAETDATPFLLSIHPEKAAT
jgi:hypothetical protein